MRLNCTWNFGELMMCVLYVVNPLCFIPVLLNVYSCIDNEFCAIKHVCLFLGGNDVMLFGLG